MTAEKATEVLTEWNRLHNRLMTLHELGKITDARAVLEEMEKLPFEEARNVAYDETPVSDEVAALFKERIDVGHRVKRMPALDEMDLERKS